MDLSQSQIYPWQEAVWQKLTQRFPKIGHGLLFYGKTGCGKHAFVNAFVGWLLCVNKQPQGACGQCHSCVWLKSDTHPHYVYLSTDEDNQKANAKISIDKVRDLQPFVQQTVEGWRVVVIDPAEALNVASSNALLKTLEEPGERVMIILIAEHYLKLPATIRSRLQHYALDRLSPEDASNFLKSRLEPAIHDKAPLLLNLSNQMPLLALDLSQATWLEQRHSFVQDWLQLVQNKAMPMQYANKWNKQLLIQDFIAMFEYLLADLTALKLKQSIKNTDIDLSVLADQYALETLFSIYDELQQSKRMLNQNVQGQLFMDRLMIQLMNIKTI